MRLYIKLAVSSGALATLLLGAPFAFASVGTFSTTTVSGLVGSSIGDLGSYLFNILPEILVILVALLSFGSGITYATKYISGSKFGGSSSEFRQWERNASGEHYYDKY